MTTPHEQLVAEEMAALPADMKYSSGENTAAQAPSQEKEFADRLAAERLAASQAQEKEFADRLAAERAFHESTKVNPFYGAATGAGLGLVGGEARDFVDRGLANVNQLHGVKKYMRTQVDEGLMTPRHQDTIGTAAHGQHVLDTQITPALNAGADLAPNAKFRLSKSGLLVPVEESAMARRASATRDFIRGGMSMPAASPVSRTLGGAGAGYELVDAYNRAREGDFAGAAKSGLGAAGSALFTKKGILPKAIGAGMLAGAEAMKRPEAVSPLLKHFNDAAAERKAAGGSVQHFDKGGVAKQLIGKGVESLASKVAPSISFNSPAKYLKKFSPEAIQSALGITPTVQNVRQITTPGIYRPNLDIVREANARVMPENPLMNSLWGVTRGDLADIASRPGTIKDPIRELIPKASKNPRGAESANNVMVPQNTERLIDLLRTTEREAPDLYRGMKGWYVLDPMWQRLAKLVGPEEATIRFNRSNMFGGLESPNLDVVNETRRAAAANYMHELGKFDDWQQYGGLKAKVRQEQGLIPELEGVPGRVGHKRASASQRNVIETGEHGMNSPKAPLYISASGTPETGFQTSVPVGDAHWSRGIGLGDVRTGKVSDASVTTPELQALTPWWRDISSSAGLEAVPAQAIGWGAFAPQTGVKTGIGAPKLEIITNLIQQRAAKTGKSPEQVRDEYLLGQERFKQGGEVGGLDALDRAYA